MNRIACPIMRDILRQYLADRDISLANARMMGWSVASLDEAARGLTSRERIVQAANDLSRGRKIVHRIAWSKRRDAR